MINVVVIDDEAKSRQALKQVLLDYCVDINILGEASNVKEGKELITTSQPDAVFLDIEMPDGTGFSLLKELANIDFNVVFTTAYDQYAIEAIKFCAVDYLLKPIQIEEVQEAVAKLRKIQESTLIASRIDVLEDLIAKEGSQDKKLPIPVLDGVEFYEMASIVSCEADGTYTRLTLADGSVVVSSKNLKEYELLMQSSGFLRVHHKHLINMKYVSKYVKGSGGYVVMTTGDKIDISRRKKNEFLAQFLG